MKTNRTARSVLVSRVALLTAALGLACSATDEGGSSAGVPNPAQGLPRYDPGVAPVDDDPAAAGDEADVPEASETDDDVGSGQDVGSEASVDPIGIDPGTAGDDGSGDGVPESMSGDAPAAEDAPTDEPAPTGDDPPADEDVPAVEEPPTPDDVPPVQEPPPPDDVPVSTRGGAPDCNTINGRPIVDVRPGNNLQAALDGIGQSNSVPTIVRLAPGTYEQKLVINTPNITLCGQVGQAERTILRFRDGNDTAGGTTASAATRINADDVSGENLTLRNTRGEGTQAVALLIQGDRVQFRDTRFIGFQDTLYVRGDRNYFRDCYVEGTVDFIFGDATAVFENCTIHNVGRGTAVTAPSTPEDRQAGIVFLGGELTADGGVGTGRVNLGRNWRPFGSTVYVGTRLGAHVTPVGWVQMGDNVLATSRCAEYRTTGPGANPGSRAPESRQLSDAEAAQYTVDRLFGSWTPSYSD